MTSLASDTADALQNALAAEYALVWVYGLATAFVSGSDVTAGLTEHTARRDGLERTLTDGGVTPQPAAAAYSTPTPVASRQSAMIVLALAESEAQVAWRAVLENTDDADQRTTALACLTDSAVRQTRWRRLSGQRPACTALPGQPPT
jgi:uncharacterized protein DUF4439